jgi:transcriptional regulator with XRE-family HTH domain
MRGMKRIRRPRSEYEVLLARKEAEGISYKQLAAETGIPESTLVLWLTRLRKERGDPTPFVEVRPEAPPRAGVEVLLASGHRVAVEPNFDEQTLVRVARALGC